MKKKLSFSTWMIISLFLLIISAAWIWFSAVPPDSLTRVDVPAPQKGFPAPDFRLETFGNDVYSLADLRGKPVLINFWASWCPPCRSEMPAIQKVYDEYKDQGFVVLAINSTHQDNLGDAITFARIRQLTFPILIDNDGSVSNLYKIRSLPTTFFIGPQGMIQDVVIGGPMAEALLRIRVEQLLRATP